MLNYSVAELRILYSDKSPHRYTWICEIEKFRLGYLSKIISIANLMKVGDNSTLRSIGLSEKANSIMTF